MNTLYNEKSKHRYKYILGALLILIFISLYFIFFSESAETSNDEVRSIISKIDKGYDVIVTSDNYVVNGKTYYTVHSNLKNNSDYMDYNREYSDEFIIDSKKYYRVNTSYTKVGNEEVWESRYCVSKENKEVYIEFRDNQGKLINYYDYNNNLDYALNIIRKTNNSKFQHIDVTIEDDIYTIHLYEIVKNDKESHTATIGWYILDINTREVKDLINDKILN